MLIKMGLFALFAVLLKFLFWRNLPGFWVKLWIAKKSAHVNELTFYMSELISISGVLCSSTSPYLTLPHYIPLASPQLSLHSSKSYYLPLPSLTLHYIPRHYLTFHNLSSSSTTFPCLTLPSST